MAENRGFVFTIDSALAVFLFILVVGTTIFLSVQASADPYGSHQLQRLGKDALVVLDKSGALASWNKTRIESTLNSSLPSSVGEHLEIESYQYVNGSFSSLNSTDYGEGIPNSTATYGARRDFVSMQNGQIVNYSIARVWIWQK
ncbi:MAG: hypothetical protein QW568_04115 [Candidatus Anstonellaceae archaeon]